MSDDQNIKLEVGIEVIQSYKRLSYTPWYAFAEFVDNSTQAYFNNKKELDAALRKEGERLTVSITYDRKLNQIKIQDNSIGMNRGELKKALQIGIPPEDDSQRSKYGLGMKTAACWFGNVWTITTKRLGETEVLTAQIDVNQIAQSKVLVLPITYDVDTAESHYTIITISGLNRQFHGKTITKIKEFLGSMYRFDFSEIGLVLNWQSAAINWDSLEKKLYLTQDGKPYKKPLSFEIGDQPKKLITGWVGVLGKGSRKDGGFSIIQNRRVIRGWPNAYKPASLYGDQDLGTNNLVNQRLIGELFMDGFAVSHTKDNILWQDNEEEELDEKLGELCANARDFAANLRFRGTKDDKAEVEKFRAYGTIESELKSGELRDKLFNDVTPDTRALEISYARIIDAAKSEDPTMEVNIGRDELLNVRVYFRSVSEFEPYVIFESSVEENTVVIVINSIHSYWLELKNYDGFLSFIRHCVYDGLAEWKASRKQGALNYDSIKYIKDQLLRLPFEISSNQFRDFSNAEDE